VIAPYGAGSPSNINEAATISIKSSIGLLSIKTKIARIFLRKNRAEKTAPTGADLTAGPVEMNSP
jgi:hypothetical protein